MFQNFRFLLHWPFSAVFFMFSYPYFSSCICFPIIFIPRTARNVINHVLLPCASFLCLTIINVVSKSFMFLNTVLMPNLLFSLFRLAGTIISCSYNLRHVRYHSWYWFIIVVRYKGKRLRLEKAG